MLTTDIFISAAREFSDRNGGTQDRILHEARRYRAVFISDVHLASEGCRAEELVDFLNHIRPEKLYLVGDILDAWQLDILKPRHIGALIEELFDQDKKASHRPRLKQSHLDVVQKLLRLGRGGTRIIYIPGNHDEFLRAMLPRHPDLPQAEWKRLLHDPQDSDAVDYFRGIKGAGNIFLSGSIVHETANGRHLYITHGDEFDALIRGSRLLGRMGTWAREYIFRISKWLSEEGEGEWQRWAIRRVLGLSSQFSLADYTLGNSHGDMILPELATAFVATQNEVTRDRQMQMPGWENEPLLDGIVCGHNHIPAMIAASGTANAPDECFYMNCGDWLKNCTALVEGLDGGMRLVRWDNERGIVDAAPAPDSASLRLMSRPSRHVQEVHL